MKLNTIAISLTIVSTISSAFTIPRSSSSTPYTPIPPSQDPWYRAPTGHADYKPGHVFKVRVAPGLAATNPSIAEAYHILYATRDSQSNPSWAVTTLLFPSGWNDTCKDKLLSYGIPYDSAALDSSPSYTLYGGNADVITALQHGWAVTAADYEGPFASFTAGHQAGHATLDSLRAIFNHQDLFQLRESHTMYALWGFSGGALASGWAAELQAGYAPELCFAGAALGGLTPNISSVLFKVNKSVYAGLGPAGILGLSSQWPKLEAYVQSHLYQSGEHNATRFNAARNYTLYESIAAYLNDDIALFFQNGLGTLESSVADEVISQDGLMGRHGVPEMPIFAYKAINDDVSPIVDTDDLVKIYCAQGATIDYQRNSIGLHISEEANGQARALDFLESVFTGTYQRTGCQITDVTVSA